jgi:hypothetical protein
MITELHLGSVRQNQDAEKCLLCRKTECWRWQKREGVLRKNNICGENVKNAREKKIYHTKGRLFQAVVAGTGLGKLDGRQGGYFR